jgi:hypothetical protein
MSRLVEVVDPYAEFTDLVDDVTRQQQRAEETLLRIEVVRRHTTVGPARRAVTTGVA